MPMTDEKWEVVEEVYGDLQAELLRGLMEAQGIPVRLNQEGARSVFPVNVGPLSLIQVMVPSHHMQEAQQVLEDYYAGKFEEGQDLSSDLSEPEED